MKFSKRKGLACLQVFTALGAIPAGILYIADPSGRLMGTTGLMLKSSPFISFLVPGIFLFVIIGLGHAVAAILAFRNHPLLAKMGLFL